ncbi:SPO22-domain-containing protein [Xylariaceae sp. FL1272]|nr:SPO22-domain-containing protein [Xylariaceae sp. FL1272]
MENKARSGASKKVHLADTVIEFAKGLQAQSPGGYDESSLQNINQKLETEIQNLKSRLGSPPKSQHYVPLRSTGLSLWNWCTRLTRDEDDQSSSPNARFIALVRVLAFFMTIWVQVDGDKRHKAILRFEILAVKTAASCINSDEYELALFALQQAAEYNGLLQGMRESLPEEELQASTKYEAEYLTLRLVLSWKQDRMDVAEHLYNTIKKSMENGDIASVEKLSDALFEIGKHLAGKKNYPLAVKWLERSYEWINSRDIELLSRDTIELRLAVSQCLIQVYIDIRTPDSLKKAENHIAYIESELGDKFIVLLFRLELLLRSPEETFDVDAYTEILRRMTRAIDLSESTFKMTLNLIRKLEDKNLPAACSALDEFLTTCILKTQHGAWIERAVILRMSMAVRDDADNVAENAKSILDQIVPNLDKPLPTDTAAGIHTLIWKRADSHYNQGQFSLAGHWCQLGLHPALAQSGPTNASKLSRKLVLCAIQDNDLNTAIASLQAMSEESKQEPSTAFLAFKVALRNHDIDAAAQCLEQVSKAWPSNPEYLYACCLEAQQAQEKFSTIQSLRHMVSGHQFHPSKFIHLPALLRTLIRLELLMINDEKETDDVRDLLKEDLCKTFEVAAMAIQKENRDTNGERVFIVAELDWFTKNAYNLGLANSTVWEARQVIRILEACLAFLSCYPQDVPGQTSADTSLRSMFCDFIIATMLLALARSEDNVEVQLQDYLNMRKHIQHFTEMLESHEQDLDEASREDLNTKLSTLLVFEFEGAVCLKSWDDLKTILLTAEHGKDLSAYQAMADCILRHHDVPGKGAYCHKFFLYRALREIVNQIWSIEHFGNDKLAKYMRCLLKVTLSMEHEISLGLIVEICSIVKQSSASQKLFPPLELEWIITTTFNHGIDLLGSHENELSKAWITHALTLAHYAQDGGEIERQLQDRNLKLSWDSQGDEKH